MSMPTFLCHDNGSRCSKIGSSFLPDAFSHEITVSCEMNYCTCSLDLGRKRTRSLSSLSLNPQNNLPFDRSLLSLVLGCCFILHFFYCAAITAKRFSAVYSCAPFAYRQFIDDKALNICDGRNDMLRSSRRRRDSN